VAPLRSDHLRALAETVIESLSRGSIAIASPLTAAPPPAALRSRMTRTERAAAAVVDIRDRVTAAVAPLLQEVHDAYSTAVRGAVFRHMHRHAPPAAFERLRLPLPEPARPAPLYVSLVSLCTPARADVWSGTVWWSHLRLGMRRHGVRCRRWRSWRPSRRWACCRPSRCVRPRTALPQV
jgi:hypothetical protein